MSSGNNDGYQGDGEQGTNDFVIREAGHLRISDFNSSGDGLIIFDTGLGLTLVDHLASFVTAIHQYGEIFIVDFWSDATNTL